MTDLSNEATNEVTENQLLEAIFDAVLVHDASKEEKQMLLASIQSWRPGDPVYEPVWMTPEMADEYLTRNIDNRPMKWHEIAQLERAIREDRFLLNGETVKEDEDGNVIDGQNRLMAISRSGKTVRIVVCRNLKRETRATLDIGVRRRTKDVLSFDDLGAGLDKGFAQTLANGYLEYCGINGPSVPEGVAFVTQNLEKVAYAISISQAAARKLRSKKLFGTAAYILAEVDPEAAKEFMHLLGTGEMMAHGNPILTLRNKMLTHQFRLSNKSHLRGELFYVFKAWNYWRQGKDLKVLKKIDGEPYPSPK